MPRNDEQKSTSNRGFASMDRDKQRQIASKGGQSVPPEKRSFSQDPQLAAQAGRKGGESVPAEGRSFSQNRELAAEAGRKGGQARGISNQQKAVAAKSRDVGSSGKPEARSQGMDAPADEERREDLEERNDLHGEDIPPDDVAQSTRSSRIGGKEYPHNVR